MASDQVNIPTKITGEFLTAPEVNEITQTVNQHALEIDILKSDSYLVHEEAVAAITWTINHDMGRKPQVLVTDGVGVELAAPGIEHIDDNNLELSFAVAQAGFAILSVVVDRVVPTPILPPSGGGSTPFTAITGYGGLDACDPIFFVPTQVELTDIVVGALNYNVTSAYVDDKAVDVTGQNWVGTPTYSLPPEISFRFWRHTGSVVTANGTINTRIALVYGDIYDPIVAVGTGQGGLFLDPEFFFDGTTVPVTTGPNLVSIISGRWYLYAETENASTNTITRWHQEVSPTMGCDGVLFDGENLMGSAGFNVVASGAFGAYGTPTAILD